MYDSSTGNRMRSVRMVSATPMVAVTASSRTMRMSISMMVAKPMQPATRATAPGISRSRNERRADSSGTTAVFTMHLSAINPEFKKTLGEGNTVNWPATDKFVASPKNDGVTATVRQTPGAIGYIEYGFAKLAKVDFAQLQNKAGKYAAPGNGAKTLAAVKLPEDMVAWLPDPDGAESYPITSYTWMIFRKANGDAAKVKAIHDMIEYGLTEGQKVADSMGYIPLPAVVVEQVRKAAANIK